MLSQYTFLRENLVARDKMLSKATRYTIMQESVISELRTFIDENLSVALSIMSKINKGKGKASYFEPEAIRALSL